VAVTLGPIVSATSGAAADRRTFGELVDELARPYDADDTTIRALAADAIRAAIRKFNAMGCWDWEIQSVEITTSANVSSYALPQAYKRPLSCHLLAASGGLRKDRISYILYNVFVEYSSLNTTGTASAYTLKNQFETGQITFYPQPTSTAYYQLDYYRETPRPRNDSEAIEIPEYALEAYMAEAWYEFAKRMPAERRGADLSLLRADASMARARITSFVSTDFDMVRVR